MTETDKIWNDLLELTRPIYGILHDPDPATRGRLCLPSGVRIVAMHFTQGKVWVEIRPAQRGYGPIFFFRMNKEYELRIQGETGQKLLGPLVARSIIGSRRRAVIFEIPLDDTNDQPLRDLAQTHLL